LNSYRGEKEEAQEVQRDERCEGSVAVEIQKPE
jgi:hypothetical protein